MTRCPVQYSHHAPITLTTYSFIPHLYYSLVHCLSDASMLGKVSGLVQYQVAYLVLSLLIILTRSLLVSGAGVSVLARWFVCEAGLCVLGSISGSLIYSLSPSCSLLCFILSCLKVVFLIHRRLQVLQCKV